MSKGAYKNNLKNWDRIRETFSAMASEYARVGLVGVGASASHGGITNAELAAVHTFGSPSMGIPARPFIAEGIRADIDKVKTAASVGAKRAAAGSLTASQAVALVGEAGTAAARNYISRGNNLAPLSAETIRAKGSSRPLVDTGQLVGAISYDVSKATK